MLVTLSAPTEHVRADGPPPGPAGDPFRVALVCMPFASAKIPSIQIGLMTAIAEQAGFETDAYYFNLDLAAKISPDLYEQMCEHRGNLTGEWVFAKAAFRGTAPEEGEEFFAAFPGE